MNSRKVLSNFSRHKPGSDGLDPITIVRTTTSDENRLEKLETLPNDKTA